MKIFHLVTKQSHIAATTFDFKDYEDNSILFMRIYKESKWHDAWAALEVGGKFTFQHGEPVTYSERGNIKANEAELIADFAPVTKEEWDAIDIGKDQSPSDVLNELTRKPNDNAGL